MAFIINSCSCTPSRYYIYRHPSERLERTDLIPVIPVYIDTTHFSFSEISEIELGIRTWDFALNGYLRLDIHRRALDIRQMRMITSSGGYVIIQIEGSSKLLKHLNNAGGTWGYASCVGCHMIGLVRGRIPSGYLVGVTLHEIGHLLGADHGDGLMYPYVGDIHQYECIDRGVIEQVAKRWRLPVDRLNYCIKM